MTRTRFATLAAILMSVAGPSHAGPGLPTVAVLDFDIVDTSGEPRDQTADHARRLTALRDFVSAELDGRNVYDVVDLAPIRDEVAAAFGRERLHACNGCDVALARKVGAERVLVAWVKKVSTLVMSLEVEVRDTATGRPVIHKSLDFRGDTDEAWRRMGLYLVRRFEELPPAAR